jgi:hypothetical protein
MKVREWFKISTLIYFPFKKARHQWLKPVILATWEAEIRMITVRGQPELKVHETPPPPSPKYQSKMVQRCDSSCRVIALQV